MTLPYIIGMYEIIHRVLPPPPPSHLKDPAAGACVPQGPSTSKATGRGTVSQVLNAATPTLAKRVDPWTTTFESSTKERMYTDEG